MRGHSKKLINAIRSLNPTVGAEIGVHKGKNAQVLLGCFPNLYLHLVDPFDIEITTTLRGDQSDLSESKEQAIQRVQQYHSRVKWHFKTSEKAVLSIDSLSLDFVFIDADHKYESVKQDIQLWKEKVRPGGIIAGHDYGGRGDKTGRFGVKKAVDECFSKDEINLPGQMVWWVVK